MIDDSDALQNIAANVSRLRGKRSKSWLAREVGTYAINISRIESGENMPGAGLLCRVAEALDTTMEGLLCQPKKIKKSG